MYLKFVSGYNFCMTVYRIKLKNYFYFLDEISNQSSFTLELIRYSVDEHIFLTMDVHM